ncbi:MAG: hypothetical protein NVSMB57_10990 [Actinomycetota bacterium]
MKRRLAALLTVLTAASGLGITQAAPTGVLARVPEDAWRDLHDRYPRVPKGPAAIRRIFGRPCASEARANTYPLVAADNGVIYPVHFHRLLGGDASSNLDNDIPGHIEQAHLSDSVRSGIWGYACRAKRGSDEWSVHSWGIAVDINADHETPGKPCRTIPKRLGEIWTKHGWTWGAKWNDCMHFQYATGY